MFPTSTDAGTFWIADIFAAMGAGGKLWQALVVISLQMEHIPLKKYINLSLSVIPYFKKSLVLPHKEVTRI